MPATELTRDEVYKKIKEHKMVVAIGQFAGEKKMTADDAVNAVKAMYAGGARVVEFLLRDTSMAKNVITPKVFDRIRGQCPDILIGVGSCNDADDIIFAKKASADFVISPFFGWDCAEEADKQKLFYLPAVESMERVVSLDKGEERSPYPLHRTAKELGLKTLKIHPCYLQDQGKMNNYANGYANSFQKAKPKKTFLGLEPSETVQNGWDAAAVRRFANNPSVEMMGGTYMYVAPDGRGGYRNLIEIGAKTSDYKELTALTKYALAAAHGRPKPKLPAALAVALEPTHRLLEKNGISL